ncbi:hypothetical protein UA08_04210 [Talaromyces atroroseus]|uniref:Uncharacterized protein n=1 Tax=Talaromyces atroroseus TaxID=1441469 RepID=A0A1Q5Q9D6_TALAT|nr:hypothetical protein UA08_04210 [Talaromyces atroroseus]OKL60682.1 hypothetical protein UA08_04210 [Talaromyces atroroseus]
MDYTLLKYLNEPNPELNINERISNIIMGGQWASVDGIVNWDEFPSFKDKFSAELGKHTRVDNLSALTEEAGFNTVYVERFFKGQLLSCAADEDKRLVRPLEQLQYYCLSLDVPYGFILTYAYIVCCHFTLSPDIQRSPRPKRTGMTQHARMQSASTTSSGIVSSMSDISLEPHPGYRDVNPVKIAVGRWNPQGGRNEFSIKLSLWLLVMEARHHRGLQQEYESPSDGSTAHKSSNHGKKAAGKGKRLV